MADAGALKGPYSVKRAQRVNVATISLLDGEAYADIGHVLEMLDQVILSEEVPTLIVTPFLPFITTQSQKDGVEFKQLRKFAKVHRLHLVTGCIEEEEGRTYHSSFVIGSKGETLGCYRKTHRVAGDPPFTPGDELPVVETALGTIGLTLTSDFYFPEVYEVLKRKGADILIWQHAPERFREHFQWLPLLHARAWDHHCWLITAHYADERPYLTNRYWDGMQGAAFGRSMIIDRSGTIRADSGYRHGTVQMVVDLNERKKNVFTNYEQTENLFFVTNFTGSAAFGPVTEAWSPPAAPAAEKRTVRIAVTVGEEIGLWRDDQEPEYLFKLLKEAEAHAPDVILFSEQNAGFYVPAVQAAMERISEWARRNSCYVIVGGMRNEARRSTALMWGRNGEIVHTQQIYWSSRGSFTDGEIRVFDADFGRIGVHTCGDIFVPMVQRVLALKGAEIIFDPSMMTGPSGQHNELLARARAVDNGVYIATSYWSTSDPGRRSRIIDPYGTVLAVTDFETGAGCSLVVREINLSRPKVYYEGHRKTQFSPGRAGWSSYFSGDLPDQKTGWKEMIFSNRRPELYRIITRD